MLKERRDIRKLTIEELKSFFLLNNDKIFRAKQVHEWVWKKSAKHFNQMTNLSKETREMLENHFFITGIVLASQEKSSDRTIKLAIQLYDKNIVEGVLIPTPKRMTACISSQVGCSLSCKFCATGKLKIKRNLEASEIYDQVVLIKEKAEEEYKQPLTNIVYMGMGEPLLNYSNVLKSVEYITESLGMSPKRITVSTAGIAKMIRRLGDDEVKFNLALSLHAANDLKRSKIMDINKSNSLSELKSALKYYFYKTKNRVTYEYILFCNFNDSLEDAEELYQFTKIIPCKVNIIEYNSVNDVIFSKTREKELNIFVAYLHKRGVVVKVRRSRGKDINAACGQLGEKASGSSELLTNPTII